MSNRIKVKKTHKLNQFSLLPQAGFEIRSTVFRGGESTE